MIPINEREQNPEGPADALNLGRSAGIDSSNK